MSNRTISVPLLEDEPIPNPVRQTPDERKQFGIRSHKGARFLSHLPHHLNDWPVQVNRLLRPRFEHLVAGLQRFSPCSVFMSLGRQTANGSPFSPTVMATGKSMSCLHLDRRHR